MQLVSRRVTLGLAILGLSGCAAGPSGAADSSNPSLAQRSSGAVAPCPGFENIARATTPNGRPLVTAFGSLTGVSTRQGVRLAPPRGPSAEDSVTNRLLGVQVTSPVTMPVGRGRDLARQMEQLYPPNLRQAGIGGEVVLLVLVDAHGAVHSVRVGRSSGYPEIDRAAQTLIQRTRFDPAIAGTCSVPYILRLPVGFKTGP